jgi:hypothetical protein
MLSAESDGEAVASDATIRAHLETCVACHEFRDELSAVRSALHGWADEFPSEGMVRLTRDTRRPAGLVRRWTAAAVLVGAIAAGFAAGRATAPVSERGERSASAAPPLPQRIVRERYVVPDSNEVYSTISLAAAEKQKRDIPERNSP